MAIDLDAIIARIQQGQAAQKKPPVHSWHPERVDSIDIVIDENNDWYHEDKLFQRQALVKLFSSILRKDEDGYYLVTPAEKLKITVEDVPFKIISMLEGNQGQPLQLVSNVEDIVTLDDKANWQLRDYHGTPVPYIEVRDGLFARVDRPIYYSMVERADLRDRNGAGECVLNSGGNEFLLGSIHG